MRIKGRRSATEIAEEMMNRSLRCTALPNKDQRGADEILGYDETGVPR